MRSRAFVRQLLLGEISESIDPVEGYLYERLWPVLFEAQAGLAAGTGATLFRERAAAAVAAQDVAASSTDDDEFE